MLGPTPKIGDTSRPAAGPAIATVRGRTETSHRGHPVAGDPGWATAWSRLWRTAATQMGG